MMALGFSLVVVAGFFQGTFVLPMTMTRKWKWEHTWGSFSLLGMLVFNWILAAIFIPGTIGIYGSVPVRDLMILVLFGAGWGIGAILFGMGMDRLGMALGYPVIMGLIASLGALIPLVVFFPEALLEPRGLVLILGTALAMVGIVFCARGGARNQDKEDKQNTVRSGSFAAGLSIAIFAGILSCLPNVGMAFGDNIMEAARLRGISVTHAGNAVWALFFTVGFMVNFVYCLILMIRHKTLNDYLTPESFRNTGLSVLMALMWIGSFYLYGMGAAGLGKWGLVVGWPLFICLSIVVGNLWGVWRGEWKGAQPSARKSLNIGIIILIIAVVTIAISHTF